MEKHIITLKNPAVSPEDFFREIKMGGDPDLQAEALALLEEGLALAVPKAMCARAGVVESGGEVFINGFKISAPFLAERLSGSKVAIPHVATCGEEAEAWASEKTDPLESFWADSLKIILLRLAREELYCFVKTELLAGYAGFIGSFNPGSLPAWPLSEQAGLFACLGGVESGIGVRLTDRFLMLPTKSLSGIFYKSGEHYENCSYCERLDCPNRRAKFTGGM